jgi:peroxiredoxin (alkyl hydroperoxide reductase subunit C)
MPRIGDKAPEFKAVTTQGEINFLPIIREAGNPLQSPGGLYTGLYVRVHDVRFTEEKFAKANCKLVGLSVDGLYSHIAWLRTIKEKIEYKGMKDVEVKSH